MRVMQSRNPFWELVKGTLTADFFFGLILT